MCSYYSQLIYKYIKDSTLSDDKDILTNNYPSNIPKKKPNVKDERAASREFLHMALLGDSNGIWLYSGSLISNRWILSVAHFERIFNNLTRWARLRDPNYLSETDDVTPMDYQIDQIVVHPDFQVPSLYNDIALFHLDQEVKFSAYVRPICLNADPNWQSSHSSSVITPGWGRNQHGGPWEWDALNAFSSGLLKVNLDVISVDLCKINYNVSSGRPQMMNGIVEDEMICASVVDGEEDPCVGFGGSSLQIAHANYTFMYTQVGVSSAGKERCATKDFPYFYMRVSKYLPWIERFVWPKSG
ncbi:venom protease-like isoform X2 [Metopolophium dirhodum]|nr:venom protease-like isoform X2 [Metopolophium dirhodum]